MISKDIIVPGGNSFQRYWGPGREWFLRISMSLEGIVYKNIDALEEET